MAAKIKTVPRSVKHVFTSAEKEGLSTSLVNALDTYSSVEKEFDAVKSSFKARMAEAESQVNTIAANIRAGFEMRVKDCVIDYDREKGEKYFYLADDWKAWLEDPHRTMLPVITEKMTDDDYQQELLEAENAFDKKVAIPLFQPAGEDSGVLVVGLLEGFWYSALRIKVGKESLEERLDSEQRSYKNRADAIKTATKRALVWLKEKTGDAWKGFEASVKAAAEIEKERVE